tara:strand:- start:287 stop:529 length:243 start_codon:yes stop_codon:yes gene_type:complete
MESFAIGRQCLENTIKELKRRFIRQTKSTRASKPLFKRPTKVASMIFQPDNRLAIKNYVKILFCISNLKFSTFGPTTSSN